MSLITPATLDHLPSNSLLSEFGPPRKAQHPESPFWRLQNDGLWEVSGDEQIHSWPREKNPKRGQLLRVNARGGFPELLYETLLQDRSLLIAIAQQLLVDHFPSSLHERILEAVGVDLQSAGQTSNRTD